MLILKPIVGAAALAAVCMVGTDYLTREPKPQPDILRQMGLICEQNAGNALRMTHNVTLRESLAISYLHRHECRPDPDAMSVDTD
jgi:hypothetical protein